MILVTGCAGFIGSRVAQELLERGEAVVGVDNLNGSYDARLKEWRLSRLQAEKGFVFYPTDVADHEGMCQLFDKHSLEAVINLAARAGVPASLKDPKAYYETNVTGTITLLELSRSFGIGKFVLASSSSIYGKGPRPFREDALDHQPLSPYAASKLAAEELCYTYHHLYGTDTTVLRYFTVYGPAGRPDMSIFRFIRWIAEGEPVILYGDGAQERDFTYVDDVARGTVLALRPAGYNVVNLGADRPVSIRRVLRLLEKLLDKEAKIETQPFQPTDVPGTWADISKARRLLDWAPETDLEQGLDRTVAWYQQNRDWLRGLSL